MTSDPVFLEFRTIALNLNRALDHHDWVGVKNQADRLMWAVMDYNAKKVP